MFTSEMVKIYVRGTLVNILVRNFWQTYAGIAFMNCVPEGTYDVIILDAFQPMGKKTLFQKIFYLKLEVKWEKKIMWWYAGPIAEVLADNCFLDSVAKALGPGGVLSAPAESLWHKNFVVADSIAKCKNVFKGSVNYAWTTVPTYARHFLYSYIFTSLKCRY